MYLAKPLSWDKGSGRYTMYLPLRAHTESCRAKGADTLCICQTPCPERGLYQIHGQSLNTHRGKHRSGGCPKSVGASTRDHEIAGFYEGVLDAKTISNKREVGVLWDRSPHSRPGSSQWMYMYLGGTLLRKVSPYRGLHKKSMKVNFDAILALDISNWKLMRVVQKSRHWVGVANNDKAMVRRHWNDRIVVQSGAVRAKLFPIMCKQTRASLDLRPDQPVRLAATWRATNKRQGELSHGLDALHSSVPLSRGLSFDLRFSLSSGDTLSLDLYHRSSQV